MDYSSLANVTKDQIKDKGRLVSLVLKTNGSYDPQNDSISGVSYANLQVHAVFSRYDDKSIDGTLVLRSDSKVLISVKELSEKPKIGDIVLDSGKEYKIINVTEIKPGTMTLAYNLQIRG